MNHFTQEIASDLIPPRHLTPFMQREQKHVKNLLIVALCPYEARSIIAEVVISAISEMMQNVESTPMDMDPVKWREILIDIIAAFQLSLDDDNHIDEKGHPDRQQYKRGMRLFKKHFLELWA